MEEMKPGKRLAPEAQSSSGAKRILIALSAIAVVLAAAYLALCAWVSASGTTLPHTTAAGLDISGLTQAQLQQKLESELTALYQGQSLRFTVADTQGEFQVPGSVVVPDAAATADAAWASSRGHFLAGGWNLLQSLAVGRQVDVPVSFSPEGEAQVDDLLTQVESRLGGQVQETTWEISGDQLLFHMGTPGRAFDMAAVKEDILSRFSRQDFSDFVLTPEVTDPAPVDAQALHSQLCAQVKDAALDLETFEVIPSVTGVDFDPSAVQSALDGAQWGEVLQVPITVTEPKVSTQALQDALFRDVLGEASSSVSGSSNRKTNVKISAGVCNDIILLPGDVFSYNNTTGSRTADKGYLPAPSYVGGKSTDEIGGGICQTSSTIYYAALNANLKIVERHNHMFAVGYVPDGMDATVWYGVSDFRFENDTDYPIKIVTNYENSRLTVQIYGTKTDELYVKMSNRELSSTAWTTVYQVDPSLPAGSTKTEQTPYRGRVVEAYRNVYDGEGNLVSSTLESKNTYKKRDQIILVSPYDGAQYGLTEADGAILPSPSSDPVPTESGTPAESQSPAPSESAAPSQSPAPSGSAVPSQSPAPSGSAAPSQSPAPSGSTVPSQPPAATESPDSAEPTDPPALTASTPPVLDPAASVGPDNGIPLSSSTPTGNQ